MHMFNSLIVSHAVTLYTAAVSIYRSYPVYASDSMVAYSVGHRLSAR